MIFRDRAEAGDRLAAVLKKMNLVKPVVMAVPRGGVTVGAKVAEELEAPLDIIVPRKIATPENPEVAIGALAQDGSVFINEKLVSWLGIDKKEIDRLIKKEISEIERRVKIYRGCTAYPDFKEQTIILTDDGAATGYTVLAAAKFARKKLKPSCLVIAVPVAPPDVAALFGQIADHVVCLESTEEFYAVGQFYQDFSETDDDEVVSLLCSRRVNKHTSCQFSSGLRQSGRPSS